jgi:hypothetical protein
MKYKTLAVVLALPFIWWLIIFIDQLNMELSCTPQDAFCNSGNTVGGDFTWSLVLWGFSMAFITPIAVGSVVIWNMIQRRKIRK